MLATPLRVQGPLNHDMRVANDGQGPCGLLGTKCNEHRSRPGRGSSATCMAVAEYGRSRGDQLLGMGSVTQLAGMLVATTGATQLVDSASTMTYADAMQLVLTHHMQAQQQLKAHRNTGQNNGQRKGGQESC